METELSLRTELIPGWWGLDRECLFVDVSSTSSHELYIWMPYSKSMWIYKNKTNSENWRFRIVKNSKRINIKKKQNRTYIYPYIVEALVKNLHCHIWDHQTLRLLRCSCPWNASFIGLCFCCRCYWSISEVPSFQNQLSNKTNHDFLKNKTHYLSLPNDSYVALPIGGLCSKVIHKLCILRPAFWARDFHWRSNIFI